jgi:hypothetical protein
LDDLDRAAFFPISSAFMSVRTASFVTALLLGLFCVAPATAQRTTGAVGLGGQIGEPTGLTLKVHNANAPSYDLLAAWDLDDFFFLNGHALFEHRIDASNFDPTLEWFVGPGAFIGVFDNPSDDEVGIGISGTAGLNLVFSQQVELYVQVTPRIGVIPETEGEVGGGLGLRYYF